MSLMVVLTSALIGCSESLVARGYVEAENADEFTISLGTASNIQIGDTLRVVHSWNPERPFITGKVKVVKILGDNSSVVKVVSGKVVQGDRVEKWSR